MICENSVPARFHFTKTAVDLFPASSLTQPLTYYTGAEESSLLGLPAPRLAKTIKQQQRLWGFAPEVINEELKTRRESANGWLVRITVVIERFGPVPLSLLFVPARERCLS